MVASWQKIEPELVERGHGVCLDSGGAIWLESGWRDPVHQASLSHAWQAGLAQYGTRANAMAHGCVPANSPETSDHCKTPARAIDLDCDPNNAAHVALRKRLCKSWGLLNNIGDEPWHHILDPKRGGIPRHVPTTAPVTAQEATAMLNLISPAVAIRHTHSGNGYWIFAADGGVFNFGDAVMYGGMGGKQLNQPIIDVEITPSGNGYLMLGADGGLFGFGDAKVFPANNKPGDPTNAIQWIR